MKRVFILLSVLSLVGCKSPDRIAAEDMVARSILMLQKENASKGVCKRWTIYDPDGIKLPYYAEVCAE
jgi:uncharacterized protein YcfL